MPNGSDQPPIQQPAQINIKSDTVLGSVYAKSFSITITDIDLTLEFVYVNPRSNEEEVVSRVTLPIEGAQQLSKGINDTLSQHFKKKGQ